MAFRMSVLLIAYAVVVCVALFLNSAIFSIRMSSSARNTALKMSLVILTQYMDTTILMLNTLQLSSSRIGSTLRNGGYTASAYSFADPFSSVNSAFQVLRPPSRHLAIVEQEEVWWSNEENTFLSVGCFRYDTTCFRSNGSVTEYVTSTFPNTPFDFDHIRTVQAPSMYHQLHYQMLSQPQFVEGQGRWSPQVVRLTDRDTPTPCNNRYVEYIMAYYDCLEYQPITPDVAARFPQTMSVKTQGAYCVHAIVSVVDLRSHAPNVRSGLTPDSHVYVQSVYAIDEVNMPECTEDGTLNILKLMPLDDVLPRLEQKKTEEWIASSVEGDNVVSNGIYKSETGVLIAFREVTPKSYYFDISDADLVTSVLITTAVIVLVVAVTCAMWYKVARPLQAVCVSIKRATMGLLEDEEEAMVNGHVIVKAPEKTIVVKEVVDLYKSYNSLRLALHELKAFAPQGLFVTEREAATAAAAGTTAATAFHSCDSSSSSSLSELSPRLPGTRQNTDTPPPQQQQHPSQQSQQLDAWCHLRDNGDTPAVVVARHPAGVWPASTAREAAEAAAVDDSNVYVGRSGASSAPPAAAVSFTSSPSSPHRPQRTTASRSRRSPPPRIRLPLPSPLLYMTGSSPVSPSSVLLNDAATRLDFPSLTRTTAFRAVNCTALVITYQYAVANLELAAAEVQQIMDVCIDVILAHSGTVETFQPDTLVVSFGAHREDALHTKRALQCAVRLFARLTPSQRQRASLVIDTGKVYVGTCGAHGRYARVIAGDRLDFAMRVRYHNLSRGRIITTDNVAQSWHTRKYVFLPFDNIVPRGSLGTQRSSIVLFQLFPREVLTVEQRQLVATKCRIFMNALSGFYEVALEQTRAVPAFDPTMQLAFTDGMETLLAATPRRPRYCRFELPPFETLGFTAAPLAQAHGFRPLLINELESTLPYVDFLSELDIVGPDGASPAADENGHFVVRPPAATGSSVAGGGGGAAVPRAASLPPTAVSMESLDMTARSTLTETFVCGDRTPHTFTDSKGEQWTLMPDCVGRGAFSEVYKAFSSEGVMMAVKCIQLSRHGIRMSDVVDEVNTSCQLWSEYIVNCTAWAHVGSYLFIVMELLAGGSLHETIRHFPHGLNPTVAKRYAGDVLRGLSYLHRSGIVHADVKPQNMLIATDGGCRVSDFGSSVTKSSSVYDVDGDVYELRGTPLYMSPEVAKGGLPTMKSDVWSFGLSLYEVLTGHLPWTWRTTGLLAYPRTHSQAVSPGYATKPPVLQPQRLLQPTAYHPLVGVESRYVPSVAAQSHEGTPSAAAPRPYASSSPGAHPATTITTTTTTMTTNAPAVATSVPVCATPPHRGSVSRAASLSPPTPPSLPGAVTVKPLTVTTFLQSVIRGDIVVQVEANLLPSAAAVQVIQACLTVDVERRPTVDEVLFMPYFYQ